MSMHRMSGKRARLNPDAFGVPLIGDLCVMPNSLDDYLPKKRFQLPGGDCFSISTMWDQETCRQLVLFQYFPRDSQTPVLEFAVSPVSADAIITALQESANQARYISGQRTYIYPEPIPEAATSRPAKRKQRSRKNNPEA